MNAPEFTPADPGFAERVKALAAQHPNVLPFFVYESPRLQDRPDAVGRVNNAMLAELLPADRDVDLYFLGPKPFMQAVHAAGLVGDATTVVEVGASAT